MGNSAQSAKKILLLWALLFAALFPCFFSFPHSLIPDFGYYGAYISERPVSWFAEHIFGLSAEQAGRRISDSKGLYVLALLVLIFSAALALLIMGFAKEKGRSIREFLRIYLRYFLAWYLLCYGFSKLFKAQFYLPEPNLLFTQLGELHPDILYWSTMGISRSYNIVMGAIELIAAALLLFRRTSFAGAFISVLILANIVAINFSYDISVKLFSSFLLFISSVLLLSDWKRLKSFFLSKPFVQEDPEELFFFKNGKRKVFIKSALVLLILSDGIFAYVRAGSFNGDTDARPVLHGAYSVSYQKAGDASSLGWKRIFYHKDDYFIIQNTDDKMEDFEAEYLSRKELLRIYRDKTESYSFRCARNESGNLQLLGVFRNDSVNVNLIKIPLDSLPLLRKEFSISID